MKYIKLLSTILLLLSFFCEAKQSSINLDYQIQYQLHYQHAVNDNDALLNVTVKFKGEADGETTIRLSAPWGGKNETYLNYKNLRYITSEHGESQPEKHIELQKENARIVKLTHPPSADITLKYQLIESDNLDASTDPVYFFAPVISKHVIHLVPYTALATPWHETKGEKANVSISIDTQGLPKEWKTAHSWPFSNQKNIQLKDFLNSILISGEIDVQTAKLSNGRELSLSLFGHFDLSSAALLKKVQKVYETTHQFWQTQQTDYFVSLVSFPKQENQTLMAGTGLLNAFSAIISEDSQPDALIPFLAHEITHDWLPRRLGELKDERSNSEIGMYWFSEGFTEYFSLINSISISGKEQVKSEFKGIIDTYNKNPHKSASNQKIVELFWSDYNISKVPYQRGFIAAMCWDAKLKETTNGTTDLGDVIRKLMKRERNEFTASTFLTALVEHGYKTAFDDYEQYIIKGLQFSDSMNPIDCMNKAFTE